MSDLQIRTDYPVPTVPTIHEALSHVMGEVQGVGKGGENKQQGYKFRGVDAVVNAVGPALRNHGVIVVPDLVHADYRPYSTKSGTQMMGCTVHVRYTFHGPAGDTIECSVMGESSDSGDKATPKAFSVAYRTALLQALCIPTDEPDPDETSHERATGPAVIDGALAKKVRDACTTKELRDHFRATFGCGAAQVPESRSAEVEDWLAERPFIGEEEGATGG